MEIKDEYNEGNLMAIMEIIKCHNIDIVVKLHISSSI